MKSTTTSVIVIVYGAFTFIGGLMGYIKASSAMSLIMGAVFGILLVISGILFLQKKVYAPYALYAAMTLSILLAGFFIPRFIKTLHFFPAGLMALLSLAMFAFLIFQRKPLRS